MDGTKLTLKFFKKFKNKKVLLILPLISLSNISKIKKHLLKNKLKFKILLKEDWPLPSNLVNKNLKSLINLKKRKLIDFKVKFGILIAYTEILLVRF